MNSATGLYILAISTKRNEARRSFDLGIFTIEAKRTWLIPKILKIEAKRTLLIRELKKIEAKRPLLIPIIRKIEAKQTLLIPYNRKNKANRTLLIQKIFNHRGYMGWRNLFLGFLKVKGQCHEIFCFWFFS
jgi:hypothetical protein